MFASLASAGLLTMRPWLTPGSAPLLVLLVPVWAWSDAPPRQPPVEEIQRLIRQLGDNCFQMREEASKRLLDMGSPAIPWLEGAAESNDPEVRHRAWRIIDQRAAQGEIPALLCQLSSGSPPIRAGAADSLGKMEAKAQGALPILIKATGDVTEYVRCSAQEAVKKIQATLPIRLDVKCSSDGVELDTPLVFRIEVSNQGKTAAGQVRITAAVPGLLTVTSVEGPITHTREGNKVVCEAVTLEPGESRYCEVHVKAKGPGNARVQVEVSADGLTAPIVGEAATTITQPAPAQGPDGQGK
jgi:hypothetical protein